MYVGFVIFCLIVFVYVLHEAEYDEMQRSELMKKKKMEISFYTSNKHCTLILNLILRYISTVMFLRKLF